jgi:Thymidylate synthase complementing protein
MTTGGNMDTPIDWYITSYMGEPRGGITKDVAFNRKSFGDDQPENPDQGNIYTGLDELRVELVQDYSDDDLRRVCSFAINATRGIDPENPPEPVDWEEMLQGGLQTALEDFRVAFAVYGMSRTGTHQLVRTRLAAFHQQSQRAHYYGDRPSVRMPESFLVDEKIAEAYRDLALHAAEFYRMATDADISYQDARFGLLEGTTNFILWEGSLRELINTYAYRACSMFQHEIMHVFREMKRVLCESHPYLERYLKISCEKTHGSIDGGPGGHACTYQGWEEVSPQCDFEWARESNRTFRSERHGIRRAK